MVEENDLDCARGSEDFWEAAALDADDGSSISGAASDNTEQSRLHLFTRPRRLTPAAETAGVFARSSNNPGNTGTGGSGGGATPLGGGSGSGDEPPKAPRRPDRASTPQGQERSVSYQPEERYWTDYLRIALPVVGLLLMLGLFWYWASNVIGDSGNADKPTAVAQVVQTANTATATTQPVVNIGTTAPTVPTATAAAGAAGNSGPATEANGANGANSVSNGSNVGNTSANTGAAGNASGNTSGNTATGNSSSGNPSKYTKGDTVTTNSDVNMRLDHSATSDPVDQLTQGTQLNVTGDGVKGGDYVWIPVDDPNTGKSGWVADTFVDMAQ